MSCSRASWRAATVAAVLLWGVTGASCSPNSGAPSSNAVDAGTPGPKCYDLVRGCHYADFGEPGALHDCHNLGHEGPESQCVVEHDH